MGEGAIHLPSPSEEQFLSRSRERSGEGQIRGLFHLFLSDLIDLGPDFCYSDTSDPVIFFYENLFAIPEG